MTQQTFIPHELVIPWFKPRKETDHDENWRAVDRWANVLIADLSTLGPSVFLAGGPGAPTRGAVANGGLVYNTSIDPKTGAVITKAPPGLGLTYVLDNTNPAVTATEDGIWLVTASIEFATSVAGDGLLVQVSSTTSGQLVNSATTPALGPLQIGASIRAQCSGAVYLRQGDFMVARFFSGLAAGADTSSDDQLQITRLV